MNDVFSVAIAISFRKPLNWIGFRVIDIEFESIGYLHFVRIKIDSNFMCIEQRTETLF